MERARASFRDLELLLVRGTDDPALDSHLAQEEAERIAEAGLEHRTVVYEGGHEIDAATLRELAGTV